MVQVREGGSTRFFHFGGWNERKRRLLIRIDRTRTNALLLSYVRTTAPEFDLIFSKKKRLSENGCRGTNAERPFSRKASKIFEIVTLTDALSLVRILSKVFFLLSSPSGFLIRSPRHRFSGDERRLSEF